MRDPEMHLRVRPFVDAALERGVRTRDLSGRRLSVSG